jgi:hypothetical protein
MRMGMRVPYWGMRTIIDQRLREALGRLLDLLRTSSGSQRRRCSNVLKELMSCINGSCRRQGEAPTDKGVLRIIREL